MEYWTARALMPVLGYDKWSNFEEVIRRAKIACEQAGEIVENHFADAGNLVRPGRGA